MRLSTILRPGWLQYGDPNPPFERKCALDIGELQPPVWPVNCLLLSLAGSHCSDVYPTSHATSGLLGVGCAISKLTNICAHAVAGDYGLGFCANSLELGCDCVGNIHYFDGILSDAKGAVCACP